MNYLNTNIKNETLIKTYKKSFLFLINNENNFIYYIFTIK